jgi:hypothetical protein
MQPLLIPLLFKLGPEHLRTKTKAETTTSTSTVKTYSNINLAILIALLQFLVLSNGRLWVSWSTIFLLLPLFFTYLVLLNGNDESVERASRVNFEEDGISISWRIIAIILSGMGLQAIVSGDAPTIYKLGIPYGFFKAISWYYTALVVRNFHISFVCIRLLT